VYVPYDYCLHAADERCQTDAGDDLPLEHGRPLLRHAGGASTQLEVPPTLAPATIITLRLVVRARGETGRRMDVQHAAAVRDRHAGDRRNAAVPFHAGKSADGRICTSFPTASWSPAPRTALPSRELLHRRLAPRNLTLGGRRQGRFASSITFRAPRRSEPPALTVRPDAVSAFEWTRLALPIPPMMPSLNQIGFRLHGIGSWV